MCYRIEAPVQSMTLPSSASYLIAPSRSYLIVAPVAVALRNDSQTNVRPIYVEPIPGSKLGVVSRFHGHNPSET